MHIDSLRTTMLRDLGSLADEIRAYPDESDIWVCPAGMANSAGTLALHLAGNLRHFIGARFGETGYVRDRLREFSERGLSRDALLERIDAAVEEVERGLAGLTEIDLDREYPLDVGVGGITTRLFLTHLSTHLAYHLGQIDFHRRLVTGNPAGVGALSIPS